jgi:hypothetical protein
MGKFLSILIPVLSLSGSTLAAKCSSDAVPVAFYMKYSGLDSKNVHVCFPPIFDRERGVSWDGRIAWRTEERAWVFAAALEGSLKGIVRADSPYHLSVAVVRLEKQTGTFVVEFSIQDPSGESLELIQVEGAGPGDRSVEEIYPTLAAEMVATFAKSVLK